MTSPSVQDLDPATLTRLSQRSNHKGIVQLLIHGCALIATASLVAATQTSALHWPALWLYGVVLVFLFAPLHECIHRTAFRSQWLNDTVAWICGTLLILPREYFRAFHLTHHRHTQDPTMDPELASPKPDNLWTYCWHVTGLPYWRERATTTIRHAFGECHESFIPGSHRPRIIREARILILVYATLAVVSSVMSSGILVTYWLIPALLGQPVLRLFLLAEHTGCPLVADMLENSRTTLSSKLWHGLNWNMPFHAEHHHHPAVPFHRLPEIHTRLKHRVTNQASGYVAAHREILRGFRERPSKA